MTEGKLYNISKEHKHDGVGLTYFPDDVDIELLDEAKKDIFEGIHRDEYGWDVSYRQTNELLDKLVQWFGDDKVE